LIYEYPEPTVPIRQGDIFAGLPRVDVSLRTLAIIDDQNRTAEASWADMAAAGKEITAVLPVRPVTAIVITQDCDTIRSRDISLCEIQSFRDVEGKAEQAKRPSSWMSIITQHARINQKWFYLPPDPRMEFSDKLVLCHS